MDPTRELRSEHEAIRKMLKILERFADGVAKGRTSETEDGEEIIDFIRTFVDRCHHAKEEECLFPLLERLGGADCSRATAILIDEHRESRALANAMADTLQRYRNGDATSAGPFAGSALSYKSLLTAHIERENQGILKTADSQVAGTNLDYLTDAFEQIEERLGHGTHQELHRLLARLEDKYLADDPSLTGRAKMGSSGTGERREGSV